MEVTGRTKSGNTTIGPWAVSGSYALFGNNELDQTDSKNYALLHQNTGQTWINSTQRIRFMINNTSQMTLDGDGDLGIGTINPTEKLHVTTRGRLGNALVGSWPVSSSYALFGNATLDQTDAKNYALLHQSTGTTWLNSLTSIIFSIENSRKMTLTSAGNLGIGVATPQRPFVVGGLQSPIIGLKSPASRGSLGWAMWETGNGSYGIYEYTNSAWSSGANRFVIERGGDVGIGTSNPTAKLHVIGTTRTSVLTITGGSDIAEPFEITNEDKSMVEAGSIVIIDENNPGKLKLSNSAYDQKVIGIISGANGVNAGMVLSQEEALGGGENVAISGRVYVKANANAGAIKPGDFLTTSDITGEAMKVTDFDKARGAIIGKAMTALDGKSGFVLVFVSLQ